MTCFSTVLFNDYAMNKKDFGLRNNPHPRLFCNVERSQFFISVTYTVVSVWTGFLMSQVYWV